MKIPSVACLINVLDPIFLRPWPPYLRLAVLDDSVWADFARRNFGGEKLIFFNWRTKNKFLVADFDNFVAHSDLGEKLKQAGIKHFILPHKNSSKIFAWAKSHKLKLVGPPLALQTKLENKVYFDSLLKKNNVSSPPTITGRDFGKGKSFVAQTADGFGLFGTSFHENWSEWLDISAKKSGLPVLIREYLPGTPCGITIFIDKNKNYFFSAIRRQCFLLDEKGFPSAFLGIQWLTSKNLDQQVIGKISKVARLLAELLGKEKFFGAANIDFLIFKGNVYVMECNPRLSSATTQIFSGHKLCQAADSWNFYINSFGFGINRPIRSNSIPNSAYAGAVLDIDIKGQAFVKPPAIGVYAVKKGKVIFLGDLIRQFYQNKNSFFVFHELQKAGRAKNNLTLCSIISHQPLFDPDSGLLNYRGEMMYNYFISNFTGK